jgi:hypothetical protein
MLYRAGMKVRALIRFQNREAILRLARRSDTDSNLWWGIELREDYGVPDLKEHRFIIREQDILETLESEQEKGAAEKTC